MVRRYFAADGYVARTETEARIADTVRFATGREVRVMLYCPARAMQLKEARIHVRWPGEAELAPLSRYAARVPRLADLERSYRNLWKFYVFADTGEPAVLAKVQEIAQLEIAEARNAYEAR
jgi:hypothetical protein